MTFIWRISRKIPQPQIIKINLKITYLKIHSYHLEASELQLKPSVGFNVLPLWTVCRSWSSPDCRAQVCSPRGLDSQIPGCRCPHCLSALIPSRACDGIVWAEPALARYPVLHVWAPPAGYSYQRLHCLQLLPWKHNNPFNSMPLGDVFVILN